MTPVILKEAERIAAQCRHYAMCKIDFLGTGFVLRTEEALRELFPQGEWTSTMVWSKGLMPMTEGLIDVAGKLHAMRGL